MEFGYWAIQGRCHHLRWLIAYLALDIKEVNPQSPEQWQEMKAEMAQKNPFINLPYFRDGNKVYSETLAVAEALVLRAARVEMVGKGDIDRITVTTLRSVISDLRNTLLKNLGRTAEDLQENLEAEYAKSVVPLLDKLAKHLGSRPFLMYYVTIPDFEFAYINNLLEFTAAGTGTQNPINEFPSLIKLCNDVKELPGVSEYLKSSFANLPLVFPSIVGFLQAAQTEEIEEN